MLTRKSLRMERIHGKGLCSPGCFIGWLVRMCRRNTLEACTLEKREKRMMRAYLVTLMFVGTLSVQAKESFNPYSVSYERGRILVPSSYEMGPPYRSVGVVNSLCFSLPHSKQSPLQVGLVRELSQRKEYRCRRGRSQDGHSSVVLAYGDVHPADRAHSPSAT